MTHQQQNPIQVSTSGNPVTATVEIAERNPSGTKGSKIVTHAPEKVEVPASKGPSASHPGDGAMAAGTGPGDAVMGIAPVVQDGQPQGVILPLSHSAACRSQLTKWRREEWVVFLVS